MRAVILVLILAVVALIIAIQTGFLDIRQTRSAEAPEVSANGAGVTATGGLARAMMTAGFPLPPPMRRALDLAAEAAAAGEVPVGAVITLNGKIVAEARNAMRGSLDPTAHAEMVAIREAAARLRQPRLDGCTLWVTLEPCAMCAGAMSLARLDAVRCGADEPKGGGLVHGARVFSQPTCHHRPDVLGGIGEAESADLLRKFFEERR